MARIFWEDYVIRGLEKIKYETKQTKVKKWNNRRTI